MQMLVSPHGSGMFPAPQMSAKRKACHFVSKQRLTNIKKKRTKFSRLEDYPDGFETTSLHLKMDLLVCNGVLRPT